MFNGLLMKILSALSTLGVSSSNVSGGDTSAADVAEVVSQTDLSPYAKLLEDKTMLITVVTSTGILVVFFALIILIVVFALFGAIFGEKKKKPAKTSAQSKQAPTAAPSASTSAVSAAPAAPAVQAGISNEVVAAIAAAVACMDGGSDLVVRSVRRAAQPQGRPAWSNAAIIENTRPF